MLNDEGLNLGSERRDGMEERDLKNTSEIDSIGHSRTSQPWVSFPEGSPR